MANTERLHYVYVLEDITTGNLYTGCTSDLKKRLMEHKNAKSTYTKYRGPYKLVYYEACVNQKDAYSRERYLKSGMGKRYIKNRLKHYYGMNPVRTQQTVVNQLTTESSTAVQPSINNKRLSEL